MTNQQLIDFIKQQLQIGITREKINSELLANGWNAQDVAEGFAAVSVPNVPTPPISNPVNTLNSNLSTNNPPVINDVTTIKEKTHSGGKIFLFVIILFLVAGFASAYYFKDEIVKLPIVKELFPSLSNKYSKNILSIDQPTGPETLNVNEMGTWTTMASNIDNAYLSYSVNWGENKEICPSALAYCSSAQSLPEKEISFSHSYAQPGIYTQTFTVTNNNGQSVSTILSVNVGGVVPSDESLSVKKDEPVQVIDCGVSGAVTFSSNKTIKADNSTEKAWECIADKLQSCTKSKLDIGGLYKFEIMGKNSNGCEVSGPKIDLKTFKSSEVVCTLTPKMLDYSFKQAEVQYPGKSFFKGYSTAQITNIGGQEIKFSDGTKEIISCNPIDVVKKMEPDTSLIVYNDPNGLYSFSYPKEFNVDYINTSGPLYPSAMITTKNENDLINVYSDVNDFIFSELKKESKYKESSFNNIDTYQAYKYNSISTSEIPYNTSYVLDLGVYDSQKLKIIFNIVSDNNNSTMNIKMEEIVKSFLINKKNISSTIKTMLIKMDEVKKYKKDFNDKMIKESLANVRPSAEIYFDKKGSYSGFCKSDDYVKITKEIKIPTTFNCKDTVNAWATTASISNGYWCVDNTGYADNSKLNTGTICIK